MYAWIVIAILHTQHVQDYKFQVQQSFVVEVHDPVKPSTETLPEFIDVPVKSQRMRENSVLADIVNRDENPVLGNGRSTDGHESTHGINSQIRNSYQGKTAGFYVLNGKAVVCREPAMRKSAVGVFVPPSLRESRFSLYVQNSPDWEEYPSYLADEWSAYINGTLVKLDDAAKGIRDNQSDVAVGPLEMGLYCVALAMAVEKHAPESWTTDSKFKAILKYQMKRAKEAFDKAAPQWPNATQDRLLNNLRTSPDAEAMRQFIKTHFDGVWLTP